MCLPGVVLLCILFSFCYCCLCTPFKTRCGRGSLCRGSLWCVCVEAVCVEAVCVEAVCACTVTWLALLFVLALLSCYFCLFCSFAGGCLQTFRGQEKSDGLLHGHSYTAHPIGCSVAIAALDAYKDPESNPNLGLFCPPPTIQNPHARRIDKDAG